MVGILAARKCGADNVYLIDRDPDAVEISETNASENGVVGVHACVSDGFHALDVTGFDLILSNPPYQTDFAVARPADGRGGNRRKPGGTMYMVTKRLDWYRNKLIAIFGGARVYETDGYYVFDAQKRDTKYARKKK